MTNELVATERHQMCDSGGKIRARAGDTNTHIETHRGGLSGSLIPHLENGALAIPTCFIPPPKI